MVLIVFDTRNRLLGRNDSVIAYIMVRIWEKMVDG
jgi:hypothetical protein